MPIDRRKFVISAAVAIGGAVTSAPSLAFSTLKLNDLEAEWNLLLLRAKKRYGTLPPIIYV